ncbi:MAG TPA: dihydrolipoyl dehydrogenase [bacterium]|nr:dihydrolipoyl dehydrogenase [bacterium]
MAKTERYDVAIIGSGPGGYVAGIRAAQRGLKSVVVEKERLGGVCLNWGCIPTKALLRNAELYDEMRDAAAYGFTLEKLGFDAGKIVERSRQVADKMNRGVASLFRKYRVEHRPGTGTLLAPQRVQVKADDGALSEIEAKDVVIATGARPRSLPALPPDGRTVITYREALLLKQFPKKLLIVGAGAIGVEFAYYFNTFGVEVHLVEMLPQLLPNEDAEMAELLLRAFKKRGLQCYVGTALQGVSVGVGKVEAPLAAGGKSQPIACDMALVAVGMEAVTQGLGLEAAGVALERGFVRVDGGMRTSAPHVYAIGDVAGHQLLAHKAFAEAEVVAAALAGASRPAVDYRAMPACTYCQPQVASIGLTEAQCQQQGVKYRAGRFPYAASGKAAAMKHLDGMVKVIYGEPYGQLLGAHMIGTDCTELLAELSLAMRVEATNEEVLATIHPHPTLSEMVFEATGVAFNESPHL